MANLQQTTEEIWKDIPGYEGYYQISDRGILKSYDRVVGAKYGKTRIMKGRVKKPSKIPSGYWFTSLYKHKVFQQFYLHQLVALTFLTKPEGKDYINHKDGNKDNNTLANLEWCTASENMKHARLTGLVRNARGVDCGNVILSEMEVLAIRELLKTKTNEEIRIILRLPKEKRHLIANIKAKRVWKYL